MCGRMTLTHPNDALAQLFEAAPDNDLPDGPRYNICPTTQIPVVVSGDSRAFRAMRWGFIPHWYKKPAGGPLLINARAETLAEKPAFKAAARARRCLIPATGFYEWTKGADDARHPWYFASAQGAPLVFAGVWQSWAPKDAEPILTCAIVTIAASAWMSETHHREPVVLARGDWATWLGETEAKAAPLMRAAPDGIYTRWRVDRAVNSNRATGPELIAPLAA